MEFLPLSCVKGLIAVRPLCLDDRVEDRYNTAFLVPDWVVKRPTEQELSELRRYGFGVVASHNTKGCHRQYD